MGQNIVKKRDIKWLLLMLIVISTPPLLAHAYARNGAHEASVIRDTQFLLSLEGLYTGPVDGQCNEGTQLAIEKYKATLTSTPPGASCSNQSLENLNKRLISALIASLNGGNATQPGIPLQSATEQHNIESLSRAISNLTADLTNTKANLTNTISTVKGLSEGISAYFTTLSSSMNNMWLTTLVTGFAILATIAIGSINIFLKKKFDDLHAEMIKDSKIELKEMISVAEAELSAKIYTQFASHSINLYKDFECPEPSGKHNKLYKSYLNIATTMAEYGYRNSVIMQDLLKKTKEDPSKEQKEVIKNCINNYIFFLSSRGEQADNEHVAEFCHELEKIILEGQTIPRWYDYVDTLTWTNLHLNRKDASKTTEKLPELVLMNPLIFAGTHIGQTSWTNDVDREFYPSEA